MPAGWYDDGAAARGEALRIVDEHGTSSVSLIGWREDETSERINCADTVKVQWSAALAEGARDPSDMGRVFVSLIEDTSGAHDLLVGGSTAASAVAAYGGAAAQHARQFPRRRRQARARAARHSALRDVLRAGLASMPTDASLECRTQATPATSSTCAPR